MLLGEYPTRLVFPDTVEEEARGNKPADLFPQRNTSKTTRLLSLSSKVEYGSFIIEGQTLKIHPGIREVERGLEVQSEMREGLTNKSRKCFSVPFHKSLLSFLSQSGTDVTGGLVELLYLLAHPSRILSIRKMYNIDG